MKTIEDFRKMRVEMNPTDFCEKYGMETCHHENAKTVHSYGGYYINEHEDGKFHVLYMRTDFLFDTLKEAEQKFWNRFVEGEMNAGEHEPKHIVYVLFGEANIEEFKEENYDEVSPTASHKFEYSTEEDMKEAIDMLYNAQASYYLIEEEEYKLLN